MYNIFSRPRWCNPTVDQKDAGSTPARSATFFREIDHEILSTAVSPQNQEGHLSVSGERMYTILVNH